MRYTLSFFLGLRKAQKVLANDKNGASLEYLSRTRLMLRFLTAPFKKRDLFADTQ